MKNGAKIVFYIMVVGTVVYLILDAFNASMADFLIGGMVIAIFIMRLIDSEESK